MRRTLIPVLILLDRSLPSTFARILPKDIWNDNKTTRHSADFTQRHRPLASYSSTAETGRERWRQDASTRWAAEGLMSIRALQQEEKQAAFTVEISNFSGVCLRERTAFLTISQREGRSVALVFTGVPMRRLQPYEGVHSSST